VLPPRRRERLHRPAGIRAGSLGGGLGYAEARLRALWDKPPFSVRVLRQMSSTGGQGPHLGEDFLWTLLAVKDAAA
jgi:hypothetical protein